MTPVGLIPCEATVLLLGWGCPIVAAHLGWMVASQITSVRQSIWQEHMAAMHAHPIVRWNLMSQRASVADGAGTG